MKNVQVFKTDVQDQRVARNIIRFLRQHFSHYKINFDLDDCDRILRIESRQGVIEGAEIQSLIAVHGYYCEILQD
jgi:hypothetical protein